MDTDIFFDCEEWDSRFIVSDDCEDFEEQVFVHSFRNSVDDASVDAAFDEPCGDIYDFDGSDTSTRAATSDSEASSMSPCRLNDVEQDSARFVRMLTFNIWLRDPLVNRFLLHWSTEEQFLRFQSFLRHNLEDYDVVALQEVFLDPQTFASFMCRHPEWHAYQPPSSTSFLRRKFVGSGLVLMSRFPILASNFHVYRAGSFPFNLAALGIAFIKTRVPGRGCIFAFNSHLCSDLDIQDVSFFGYWILRFITGNLAGELEQFTRTRMNQVGELIRFIEEMMKEHHFNPRRDRVVLMGDFNIDAHIANPMEYHNLLQAFQDANLRIKDLHYNTHDQHVPTFPAYANRYGLKGANMKQATLDYIFLSGEEGKARAKRIAVGDEELSLMTNQDVKNMQTLSDHLAIEGWFNL